MNAQDILTLAGDAIGERAAHRDTANGERSIVRAAAACTALFRETLLATGEITPRMYAMMMLVGKLSRAVTSSKLDNWVDAAGYAALAGEQEAADHPPIEVEHRG